MISKKLLIYTKKFLILWILAYIIIIMNLDGYNKPMVLSSVMEVQGEYWIIPEEFSVMNMSLTIINIWQNVIYHCYLEI